MINCVLLFKYSSIITNAILKRFDNFQMDVEKCDEGEPKTENDHEKSKIKDKSIHISIKPEHKVNN